ncbi:MAG: flagellar protein FliT [Roseburia sp.]|nr:flagellar protein FliT [Roseburia sp.]
METAYVSILVKSLEDKLKVLNRISDLNKQQTILLGDANVLPEELEQNMEYKANLVKELERLDEGFESTFAHVRETLNENRQQYAEEIARMQELIKAITDTTTAIQTQEIRNRDSAKYKFEQVRSQVKGVRNSQKVVNQYYENMRRQKGAVTSQMFDNKK